MDYLVRWRAKLPDRVGLFSALARVDARIGVTYGVVGGALLWSVRDDRGSSSLREALASICGTAHVDPLLRAVEALAADSTPLDGALLLTRMAKEDGELRAQLDRLIGYFLEECLRHDLLKRSADVRVEGSVSGANIVIGGTQYVAGDLVVTQTVVRPRPVAPDPPPHFTGRATELAELRAALSQGRNVAITSIHGMGGIGKTATALRLAADMSEFGVVLWASLGPAPNPVALLTDWARYADPEFEAGNGSVEGLVSRVRATLAALVRDHFPGERVLVVLDDIWEGDSVTTARHLRAASPPGTVHLITTRSRRVVSQLRSTGVELHPMTSDDAVGMLRVLLSDFPALAEGDLRELAEIVGHHPLAMELAAGQVQLLERPDAELGELLALYRGGIPAGSPFRGIRLELGESREDNLELVLSFSYDQLDAADQARFRALGVLAYGADFDRSLCEAIWGDAPKPVLDRFRHRALLSIATSPGWYHQHQLLRAYARALLHSSQDRSLAEDCYTAKVVDISTRFAQRPLDQWNELNPYIAHMEETGTLLVPAVQAELSGKRPDRARLDRMLTFALNTRHLLATRTELHHPEWMSTGAAVSSLLGESSYEVVLLNSLAKGQHVRGDPTAAIRSLYQARRRAESSGDTAGTAMTNSNLGAIMLQYDPDAAPQWLYRSVELWTRLGDEPQLAHALLQLADWQAHWFRTFAERATAIMSLSHASHIAGQHNLGDVQAETFLRLGRLFDTLGSSSTAATMLRDAVEKFEQIGQRDREGVARLFLAGAIAADEPDYAASLLKTAISLFATTGHTAGHATALRNLAQLHAEAGRHSEALAAHAAALPLARLLTEEFLDEDSVEEFVVRGHFVVRYEDVARLNEIEQYRVKGRRQADRLEDPAGVLPEDLRAYLIGRTISLASSPDQAGQEWAEALRHFIEDAGELHSEHAEFVNSLIDVTLGNSERGAAGTGYAQIVAEVRTRAEQLRDTGDRSHLTGQGALQWAQRTLFVLVDGSRHRADWERTLRANLRSAWIWSDVPVEDYCRALLCVLGGQPAALPADHPHCAVLNALLDSLFEHQRLPTHVLVERTVATLVLQPGELAKWTEHLKDAKRDSSWRGDRWSEEFIAALIALASGDHPLLGEDNPYYDEFARAVEAVTNGTVLFSLIPNAELPGLMDRVVAARTDRPKTTDGLAQRLGEQAEEARGIGRHTDADLYAAAVRILQGESPELPAHHPYAGVVEMVTTTIGEQGRAPCVDQTLPDDDVARLVDLVVSVRSGVLDETSGIGEYFTNYLSIMEARGADWRYEASFLAALGDLLEGRQPELAPDHPYSAAVRRAQGEVRRNGALARLGGRLSVADLRYLLDSAAERLRARQAFTESFVSGMPTGQETVAAFLRDRFESPELRHIAWAKSQWEHNILAWRDDLVRREPQWQHEIELVDAVLALVNLAPMERLSQDNPYVKLVRELAEAFPPTLQLPADDSIAALALSKNEFTTSHRHNSPFAAMQDLDTVLTVTVLTRTTAPHQHEQTLGVLQSRFDALPEHVTFTPEREFLDALIQIVRAEDPALPAGHRYETECQRAQESIDLFHGKLTWPGSLTSARIMRFISLTGGALSNHREHLDTWREQFGAVLAEHTKQFPNDRETGDFLQALAILLQGRAAHLPPDNRYDPFLAATRYQIQFA
ncbi:NB-ARC domain-containing protein [Amycolatopsis sp. cmx-11-12]|uniref:NB-ARC domain-containing protein n=1 Tax=Amycolatopsis sp. cmx-11-12 TaxID=2785795 RepID=UPI003917C18F